MKSIEVQCIVFTQACFRENIFVKPMINSIFDILEGGIINLIFIQESNNSSINQTFIHSFKNKAFRFIVCNKYYRKDKKGWYISVSSGEVLYIEKDILVESIVEFVQKKYLISKENTVTVGRSIDDLILKNRGFLHFHVGEEKQIPHKIRGLIPLTNQYEIGLLNIVLYFSKMSFKDEAIDYHDLIEFVYKSSDFFSSRKASSEIMYKHRMATQYLRKKFKDEIVAIFGTGFPFYLLNADGKLDMMDTPKSIIHYFYIQKKYFSKKSLNADFFDDNKTKKFREFEMQEINIYPRRNKFDKYKYEKMGYSPPIFEFEETEEITLEKYYFNNCFDISSDVWPCYYCSTLQNNDLFPNQVEIKDTNITCLSCKQTSFMLRNIMGCSADLDMVVVVNTDKQKMAECIKNYIIRESPYHFYDMKFYETFKDNDGPLDLFVTQTSDLLFSFKHLLADDWINTTFDSIALWSPSIKYKFNLGIDFALAFEPHFCNEVQIQKELASVRREFVVKHGVERIIENLSNESFYTQQLLSNEDLVKILKNKLNKWSQ